MVVSPQAAMKQGFPEGILVTDASHVVDASEVLSMLGDKAGDLSSR